MEQSNNSNGRAMRLIKNVGIYAVGNIGSRLIMFMLVPIYSFFIAPDEMGYYDICFTALLFLLPIISFQFREGSFRFLLDADNDEQRSRIITFIAVTLARNSAVCLLASAVLALFADIRLLWLTTAFSIIFACYEVIIQIVRGMGHTKMFVGAGVLCSFITATSCLVLITVFHWGIEGIFVGNILGRAIVLLILELRLHLFRHFFRLSISYKEVGREILRYSLPLIPGNLCGWVISNSNRFFILVFVGTAANGQFSVAFKFAQIVETLAYVFYQAWQEMSIQQFNSADRNQLFSKVLNSYVWTLTALVTILSFSLKIAYPYIVGPEYQESLNYVIILLTGYAFAALSYFYELGYQCSKTTSRIIPGYLVATVSTLALNFALIPSFGIYGVLVSVATSYLVLLIYRIIDTRSIFTLSISKASAYCTALLAISIVTFYCELSTAYTIAYLAAISIIYLAMMPADIKQKFIKKIGRN